MSNYEIPLKGFEAKTGGWWEFKSNGTCDCDDCRAYIAFVQIATESENPYNHDYETGNAPDACDACKWDVALAALKERFPVTPQQKFAKAFVGSFDGSGAFLPPAQELYEKLVECQVALEQNRKAYQALKAEKSEYEAQQILAAAAMQAEMAKRSDANDRLFERNENQYRSIQVMESVERGLRVEIRQLHEKYHVYPRA